MFRSSFNIIQWVHLSDMGTSLMLIWILPYSWSCIVNAKHGLFSSSKLKGGCGCNFEWVPDFYTFYYTFISKPPPQKKIFPMLSPSNQYPLDCCYWHSFFPNFYPLLYFCLLHSFKYYFVQFRNSCVAFDWVFFLSRNTQKWRSISLPVAIELCQSADQSAWQMLGNKGKIINQQWLQVPKFPILDLDEEPLLNPKSMFATIWIWPVD